MGFIVRVMHSTGTPQRGFTLIELSIVLVVLGLIVGGVLVGQYLIRSAAARATITQIQKYQTAANTFRDKYAYLPGDIKDPQASGYGFQARGSLPGQGDGNGVIMSHVDYYSGGGVAGNVEMDGETVVFWTDLSAANLIDGAFNTAIPYCCYASIPNATVTLGDYFPAAKLGQNNYIYVYSGGFAYCCWAWQSSGKNYFGLSAVGSVGGSDAGGAEGNFYISNPGLTVQQAYAIDKKMDDGLPQTGMVTTQYLPGRSQANNPNPTWSGVLQEMGMVTPDTSATAGSSTTCYDNGNVAGAVQQYSMEINNGAGVNCALSFEFQ
jgi:prepilin-type N-terminal cleavage/methylation domain-containing protein